MSTNRLRSHLLILSVVAFVISAEFTHALPYPQGVSKAVYYRPGLMGKIACKRKVIPCENGRPLDPPCLVSSALSNKIGSEWELSAYNRKLKRVVTERAVQVDVSHPHHRNWQMRDGRYIETDYYCQERLTGGHYAPWEASIKFKQVQP